MPLLHSWKQKEARFAIWHITETMEELRVLYTDEHSIGDTELLQLKSESRKIEYLCTRILLQTVCGEGKEIGHFPSGKPYLTDGSFHISISHTHGYAAIAIHPSCEVGIDIEYMADRVMKVTERFLSQEELSSLPTQTKDRNTYALLCWSAKETAFKALGADGVDFRKHFNIRPFTLTQNPVLHLSEYRTSKRNEFSIYTMRNDRFVCTWCIVAESATSSAK